jgi:hypothetical protein
MTSEMKFALGLGSLSATLEWAFVAKGGKPIPLLDFFFSLSPSSLEELQCGGRVVELV